MAYKSCSDTDSPSSCEPPPPGLEIISLPASSQPAVSNSTSNTAVTNTGKPSATVIPRIKQEPRVPVDPAGSGGKRGVSGPASSHHPYYNQQQQQHYPPGE